MESIVILHNLRSAHNVGSIFRTANSSGALKIYLTGYTPAPLDRFGRAQKEISKTALGAEKYLEWEHKKNLSSVVVKLKKDGFEIIGVEQDDKAVDYRKFNPKQKTVFVFGNEVRGLSKQARSLCDKLIEIPIYGRKESLNVAVTVGIVLFSFR